MQFDDFLKVIDLLKDPVQYEVKIAELKARDAAIQSSIAELGVKGDINKAQAKVDALLVKAEKIVSEATTQAQTIITNAQAAFDKRHLDLKAREVVADQAVANYNTIKEQLAARQEVLRAGEKLIENQRVFLEQERVTLRTAQLEVDERLAKLRQAMN